MDSILNWLNIFIDFLIVRLSQKYRWANRIWLALLFCSGIGAWKIFLDCPDGFCSYNDWGDIVYPRFDFLQQAALNWALPLHASNDIRLGDFFTKRYMVIPDAFLSPQYLLLRFLTVEQFVFVQTALFFALGFWGLLWLRKKFGLSNLNFTVIFFLFNFNGHILAHLSVGHLTWSGYFLFPWFVILLMQLIDGQANWAWIAKMSALLFVTLLQGSYHQFIWMLFFIGLLAIFMPRHFFTLLKAAIVSVVLSACRILPLFSMINTLETNKFLTGYPSLQTIWTYMITISNKGGAKFSIDGLTNYVGLWEMSIFTGLIGALFLIYFGLIRPLQPERRENPYLILLPPAAGMLFLSLDRVYRFISSNISFSLIVGERTVSRFISLVLVVVLILAAAEFQNWLDKRSESKNSIWVVVIFVAIGINDLVQNFREWSVQVSYHRFPGHGMINPQWNVMNDFSDNPYVTLVAAGAVVTVLTAIFLFWMIKREKKQAAA
jgi:hypothetical protein